jgi:hypothetical protein
MSMGVTVMMGMIVTAMIVVVLIVSVIAMTVPMRIIRAIAPGVGMPVAVGATLRIEGRFDLDDAGAEAPHHFFDDMIAADPKTSRCDLRLQMPVTEMPGHAHQMMRILAADFGQRLGRGHDLDQPPVFEHQRIATAQRRRDLQIEQKLKPTRSGHGDPPAMAIIEIEHNGIGSRLDPAVLLLHLRRAHHT